MAARSYLHAWLPRPEPLTRRATSPPSRATSGRGTHRLAAGRTAWPRSARVNWLQMGALGTRGLSLFGGDLGALPGSASNCRDVPRVRHRCRSRCGPQGQGPVRTAARGCGWVGVPERV